MKPSTTVRATSSRFDMRVKAAGSMNLRGCGVDGCAIGIFTTSAGHGLQGTAWPAQFTKVPLRLPIRAFSHASRAAPTRRIIKNEAGRASSPPIGDPTWERHRLEQTRMMSSVVTFCDSAWKLVRILWRITGYASAWMSSTKRCIGH